VQSVRFDAKAGPLPAVRSSSAARPRSTPAVLVRGVVIGALLLPLAGCGPAPEPESSTAGRADATSSEPAVVEGPGIPAAPKAGLPSAGAEESHTEDGMADPVETNMALKKALGAAYTDAWVADGLLHVAVTDTSFFEAIRATGAVPVQAAFSAAELQAALRLVQDTGTAAGVALHKISSSGQTGITAFVPAGQVEQLRTALAGATLPANVPVAVAESTGVGTPLATNNP